MFHSYVVDLPYKLWAVYATLSLTMTVSTSNRHSTDSNVWSFGKLAVNLVKIVVLRESFPSSTSRTIHPSDYTS